MRVSVPFGGAVYVKSRKAILPGHSDSIGSAQRHSENITINVIVRASS